MNRDEMKLYKVNKISYNLIMIFVLLNTAHAIFSLQNMMVNYRIGFFIMSTILISMLSFLTAVKLQTYSIAWSYVALGIGGFQVIRFLTRPKEIVGDLSLYLTILILLSVVFIIAGGIISIIQSKKRTHYLQNHYFGNEEMHK